MKELKVRKMHHYPEIHMGNCSWLSSYPTQLLRNISTDYSIIRPLIMYQVWHHGAGKEDW